MSNAISRSWRRYSSLPTVQREVLTLVVMLLVAVTILPVAIWLAGQFFLGAYLRDPAGARTGGPFDLIVDFLQGLGSGSPGHWLVLLGPYVLVCAFRGARYLTKT
ncbi:MAG: hypothetical protein ABW278_05070 [Steroidobacteraceae bacterium]